MPRRLNYCDTFTKRSARRTTASLRSLGGVKWEPAASRIPPAHRSCRRDLRSLFSHLLIVSSLPSCRSKAPRHGPGGQRLRERDVWRVSAESTESSACRAHAVAHAHTHAHTHITIHILPWRGV